MTCQTKQPSKGHTSHFCDKNAHLRITVIWQALNIEDTTGTPTAVSLWAAQGPTGNLDGLDIINLILSIFKVILFLGVLSKAVIPPL